MLKLTETINSKTPIIEIDMVLDISWEKTSSAPLYWYCGNKRNMVEIGIDDKGQLQSITLTLIEKSNVLFVPSFSDVPNINSLNLVIPTFETKLWPEIRNENNRFVSEETNIHMLISRYTCYISFSNRFVTSNIISSPFVNFHFDEKNYFGAIELQSFSLKQIDLLIQTFT